MENENKEWKGTCVLGMKIVCQDDSNFRIGMKPHLESTIEEFEKITIEASNPARSDLFAIDKDQPLADEDRKKLFHLLVHSLSFTTGIGRKDLELATSFLAGRPDSSNEGDYFKLWRLMHCMCSAKDLEAMHALVDESCVVHHNMLSHTGGAIYCGIGVFTSDSKKQELNTKSSTEAELIGISNVMTKVTFIQLFLEA